MARRPSKSPPLSSESFTVTVRLAHAYVQTPPHAQQSTSLPNSTSTRYSVPPAFQHASPSPGMDATWNREMKDFHMRTDSFALDPSDSRHSIEGQSFQGSEGEPGWYASWSGDSSPSYQVSSYLPKGRAAASPGVYPSDPSASTGPPATEAKESLVKPVSWEELEQSCCKLDGMALKISQIDLTCIADNPRGDPKLMYNLHLEPTSGEKKIMAVAQPVARSLSAARSEASAQTLPTAGVPGARPRSSSTQLSSATPSAEEPRKAASVVKLLKKGLFHRVSTKDLVP